MLLNTIPPLSMYNVGSSNIGSRLTPEWLARTLKGAITNPNSSRLLIPCCVEIEGVDIPILIYISDGLVEIEYVIINQLDSYDITSLRLVCNVICQYVESLGLHISVRVSSYKDNDSKLSFCVIAGDRLLEMRTTRYTTLH